MILSLISAALWIIGIALLMKLDTEQITDDAIRVIRPNETLAQKAKNLRRNKKKQGVYYKLMEMKTALEATGKKKQFSVAVCASAILFVVGIFLSIVINNLFLMPVISATMALLPFFYLASTLSFYERKTREELETTLSMITTSYERSDDILSAVRENLVYIKPPLRAAFQAFEGDATAVSSDIKHALYNLRDRVDNEVFREWCETLIQCQDDRTMKDTLLPIVQKLTDVRLVNSELKTMLGAARNEYWCMVALVLGNIPLLYLLNKDWYHTLIYGFSGKLVLGICGVVIFVTAMFMMKFTKPIEYKR